MITVFKNILDLKNPNYTTVEAIYERIRKGKDLVKVNQIRGEEDKGKRSKLKAELPCICFSGKFSERFDDKLLEHSGRAVLDLDSVEGDLEQKRAEMASYGFVEACFISPSGDGLKVVCRIPANIEKHRGYYKGLMKLFPQSDSTSINESRVCYSSYDPNIYVNMNTVEFTDYVEPPLSPVRQYAEVEYREIKPEYSILDRGVKMIRNSVDGQKHNTLLRAARLMGGYIAIGKLIESEVVSVLEREIQARGVDDFNAAQKTIQDGIGYGKAKPVEVLEKESITPTTSAGVQLVDELWEGMKKTFREGKKRGSTTHFPKFDENFKWKAGEITLVIARPNAGKTEFSLQLMLAKSVFDGWKWGVFSPENYPADEFYDSLIHTYIGKTTDPIYGSAQMSMSEYEAGYRFIREHFYYVYPELHTIEELDSNFDYLINEIGINGTFLDPFNQITTNHTMRDDVFLSNFLSVRKRKAIKHQLHDVISTHPKSMSRNKSGEYDIPDMYDIAGGAMWGNKMDNIIVIHRPKFLTNPMDTTVEIHVRKIKKQKLVGIPGTCVFDFKRKTNRYYIDDISPFDRVRPTLIEEDAPVRSYEDTTKAIIQRRLSQTKEERHEAQQVEQEQIDNDLEDCPF
jgi:twinkle protein